jgi:hypothetical protein
VVVGLAAWSAEEPRPVAAVHFGQPLVVSAEAIGTDPAVPLQYATGAYLGVASDETNSLVVFYDGGRIRAVRYDELGTVLDLDQWIQLGRNGADAAAQGYPNVAFGGGVYLVVYDDFSDLDGGVYAQAVGLDGSLLSEPVLVAAGGYYASVVFNGSDFSVSWCEGNLGLARVALDGTMVEGSTNYVTTGGTTNRSALTINGDLGLVVFEQSVNEERRV